MGQKTNAEAANRLAGLQIDELQKIRNGHITLDQKEWYNNLYAKEREQLFQGNYELVAKPTLKNLESKGIVSIPQNTFKPADFFVSGNNGTTKLLLKDGIEKIFLPLLSEEISFDGIDLEKLQLKTATSDLDVYMETGKKLQSADDIASALRHLASRQAKGEDGVLETTYNTKNIFYFEYKGRVWCLLLHWFADNAKWDLSCYEAYGDGWPDGFVIFNPITPESKD
mgnify:CR=1 FL=1